MTAREPCLSNNRGVMPDVAIAINEVRPAETLDALLQWIRAHG